MCEACCVLENRSARHLCKSIRQQFEGDHLRTSTCDTDIIVTAACNLFDTQINAVKERDKENNIQQTTGQDAESGGDNNRSLRDAISGIFNGSHDDSRLCDSHYHALRRLIKRTERLKCVLCHNVLVDSSKGRRLSCFTNTELLLDTSAEVTNGGKSHIGRDLPLASVRSLINFMLLTTGLQEPGHDSEQIAHANSLPTAQLHSTYSEGGSAAIEGAPVHPGRSTNRFSNTEQYSESWESYVDFALQNGMACLSCYMHVRRRFMLVQRAVIGNTPSLPATLFFRTEQIEQELQQSATKRASKVKQDRALAMKLDQIICQISKSNTSYVWLSKSYKLYESNCKREGLPAASQRCFRRALVEKTDLTTHSFSGNRKGTLLCTANSAMELLEDSVRRESNMSGSPQCLSPESRNEAFSSLSVYYAQSEVRVRIRNGDYSLLECVSDINRTNPLLLRSEMLDTESKKESCARKIVERALETENEDFTTLIPPPYGSGEAVTEETLRVLTPTQFKKMINAISIIQQKSFARNSKGLGPMLWWFGTQLLLHGDRYLLKTASKLGVSPSYQALRMHRKHVYQTNKSKPLHEKLDSSYLVQAAWDNIDSMKAKNNIRSVGCSLDFHGTILSSSQSPRAPPIGTLSPRTVVSRTEFQRPQDMLKCPRVADETTVRSAEASVMALCWFFRHNLTSSVLPERVSLGHLLKISLQSSERLSTSTVENILFIDQPSNSEKTTLSVMRSVLDCAQKMHGGSSERILCLVTADNPLYLQMMKLIHDTSPGKRNPEFEKLLPQMGLMHTSMAMLDAAKHVAYDACLDGLIQFSGLSNGAQSGFRDMKDFKTNLRFFCQAVVAMSIRFTEMLVEDGEIGSPELQGILNDGQVKTLAQLRVELESMAADQSQKYPEWFQIRVRRNFFPPQLVVFGDKVASRIRQKITSLLEPNASFFGTVLLKILLPCVTFHYFSRCGQLKERNCVLSNFIPVFYLTGKNNYQHALFCDIMEKITMPGEAHDILYGSGGTACNLTGTRGNDLHNDEALETRSVLPTKQGAGNASAESLQVSFYTSKQSAGICSALEEMVCRPRAENRAGNESFAELRDKEAKSSSCVLAMLEFLRQRGWMGSEHRSVSLVTNVLSADGLFISDTETDRAVRIIEYGKMVMDLHGKAVFYPWRDVNKRRSKWTRKYKVGLFAAARMKQARDTKEARGELVKRMRREQVRKTLGARALDLAQAERNRDTVLCDIIRSNMDLVSPLPLAFMSPGSMEPLHSKKSDTVLLFEHEAEGQCDIENFVLDGYPVVENERVALAVDGMDYVHNEVNRVYSLTTRMHIDQLAHKALDIPMRSTGKSLARIDIHFDTPELVPLAKCGEQARRDSDRSSRRSTATTGGDTVLDTHSIELDKVPQKEWNQSVLSDRTAKAKLVNAMSAFVLFRAIRMATAGVSAPEVRVFGAKVIVDDCIQNRDLSEESLDIIMLPCGAALLTKKSSLNVESDSNSARMNSTASADAAICWIVLKNGNQTTIRENTECMSSMGHFREIRIS